MTDLKNPIGRIRVLDVPISVVQEGQMDEIIRFLLSRTEPSQIIFLSFRLFMKARRNEEWLRCLNHAALVLPTSPLITWGAKFLMRRTPSLASPFQTVIRLLGALEKQQKSAYLLGDRKEVVLAAEKNLRTSFPGLSFVGRHAGHCPPPTEKNVLVAIKKAIPSFLLVGKGFKGNDLWLYRNRRTLVPTLSLWGPDLLPIFAGKTSPPSRKKLKSIQGCLGKLLLRPWNVFLLFSYIRYIVALVIHKMRGL